MKKAKTLYSRLSKIDYGKLVGKKTRATLGAVILVLTALLFIRYARNNPGVFSQIKHISLGTFIVVIILYILFSFTNAAILFINTRMCGVSLGKKDSFLLNAYSTIVNFFGPLQSGPGFRAVYLKKKLGVSLRSFTVVMFFYLFFYALFSGFLLLTGAVNVWLAFAIALVLCLVAILLTFLVNSKSRSDLPSTIKLKHVWFIGVTTLVQVFLISFIYFTELTAIDASISYHQALIYTGAANFGLFVSITPGAIGIRESFLLFSQNLHHISPQTILTASLMDRAIYFVFLGLLFICITALQAKTRLKIRS